MNSVNENYYSEKYCKNCKNDTCTDKTYAENFQNNFCDFSEFAGLSFEKQDADYKALKTLMDGQLQAMPKNVVIYATSNRKHLVKESWSDRQPDDVHANDNMQETLSLAERFGISLVFSLPNQKEYLQIVGELLARNGIEMTAEIEKQAMVWQMNYGSKSPRCATQCVYAYCQNRT